MWLINDTDNKEKPNMSPKQSPSLLKIICTGQWHGLSLLLTEGFSSENLKVKN